MCVMAGACVPWFEEHVCRGLQIESKEFKNLMNEKDADRSQKDRFMAE